MYISKLASSLHKYKMLQSIKPQLITEILCYPIHENHASHTELLCDGAQYVIITGEVCPLLSVIEGQFRRLIDV